MPDGSPTSDAARPVIVRSAPRRPPVDEWSLVLAASGIEARVDWSPQGYHLLVDESHAGAAAAALAAYDEENRPPARPPPAPEYGPNRAAIACAAALAAFFALTGPRGDGGAWFAHGASDAAHLADGEWWRLVTALTLHADFLHILANAVTLVIFGSALGTMAGPGVALALLVLSGAGGNLLTAVLRGAPYSAVGASTGIFGIVGALAALQLVRRRRGAAAPAWRAWAPLAAGVGLLAMIGSSPRSDVLAHLFGFAVGTGLGAALGTWHPRPLAPARQRLLVGAVIAAVGGCWILAWTGA